MMRTSARQHLCSHGRRIVASFNQMCNETKVLQGPLGCIFNPYRVLAFLLRGLGSRGTPADLYTCRCRASCAVVLKKIVDPVPEYQALGLSRHVYLSF